MKDHYWNLYGPMIEPLLAAFGVTFEFWDTGGGCTALVGQFDSDAAVYLTDAPVNNGREAQITDYPRRAELGEVTVGFAVGVYRNENQTQVAYGEYPHATTADLPTIVRWQLIAAGFNVAGLTAR